MIMRTLFFVTFLSLVTVPANAQFGEILKALGLDQEEELSDDTVVSGLKEALQVGTGNAVDITGKLDGYFLNEAIKILMPEKLKAVEKGLRIVGYGPQLDEFVLSMNRAQQNGQHPLPETSSGMQLRR